MSRQHPMVGRKLTAGRDPEPPVGTIVECFGKPWGNLGDYWVALERDGDPETWNKIAGNYGPVTVVEWGRGAAVSKYPEPPEDLAETVMYVLGQHLRIAAEQLTPNLELRQMLWGPNRRPSPPAIPGGCYDASFGWVHVKPGCHCPR